MCLQPHFRAFLDRLPQQAHRSGQGHGGRRGRTTLVDNEAAEATAAVA